jgi:predicted outer membrane repeat protein
MKMSISIHKHSWGRRAALAWMGAALFGGGGGVAFAQSTITVPTDIPTLELALNPVVSGLAAGDTIELLNTTGYFGSFTVATPDITIRGVGATPIEINPFGTGRAFNITAVGGTTTFENLRIINGDAGAGFGGAIYTISARAVEILGCEFDANMANQGGAVFTANADLIVESSVFTNNTAATIAGAIRTTSNGGNGPIVVTITDTLFDGNRALDGSGGVINHAGVNSGVNAVIVIVDSTFRNNTCTETGGAIFASGVADVTLLRCDFFDNAALGTGTEDAGGVYINESPSLLVDDCDFERNLAPGSGGALRFNNSSGSVVNSRFVANEASRGGGLYVIGDNIDVSVFNSVFTGNSARRDGDDTGFGGAVSAQGSNAGPNIAIYNSLFTGNTALSAGAVEIAANADVLINNCTFFDNDADAIGGAVRRTSTTATAVVNSSIAFGNIPTASQIAVGGQGLDEVNFSLVEGGYTGVGVSNIDADPLFANSAAGDFSLLPGSPAIDAGSSARYGAGPLSDLGGNVRGQDDPLTVDIGEAIVGAVIDMGAFEFTPDTAADTCPEDTDADGFIGTADLLNLLARWGQTCP